MDKVLWVMLGGALGSGARYLISQWISKWHDTFTFLGTLSVNVIGSLLIGIAFFFFERENISQNGRLFLMLGFLGGFTTFSSFALDSFQLMKNGDHTIALVYILSSNVLSILAAVGVYILLKHLFS